MVHEMPPKRRLEIVPPKVYLICGSRDFKDSSKMVLFLAGLPKPDVVISGMATGADSLACAWAAAQKIPVREFPVSRADWKQYGHGAGMRRNQQMFDEGKPTLILGFPTDPTQIGTGTAGMLNIGLKGCVPTYYAGEKEWVQVNAPVKGVKYKDRK